MTKKIEKRDKSKLLRNIRRGEPSPWLQSVQKSTGLDPNASRKRTVALLVVDISGSMAGPAIEQARKGVLKFSEQATKSKGLVGLETFSCESELLVEPSASGIGAQLESIRCGGTTNMTSAINLATTVLEKFRGKRTMVIATDGYPDEPQSALSAADKAKYAGIQIITIGTETADQDFLRKLASKVDHAIKTDTRQLGRAIAESSKLLLSNK